MTKQKTTMKNRFFKEIERKRKEEIKERRNYFLEIFFLLNICYTSFTVFSFSLVNFLLIFFLFLVQIYFMLTTKTERKLLKKQIQKDERNIKSRMKNKSLIKCLKRKTKSKNYEWKMVRKRKLKWIISLKYFSVIIYYIPFNIFSFSSVNCPPFSFFLSFMCASVSFLLHFVFLLFAVSIFCHSNNLPFPPFFFFFFFLSFKYAFVAFLYSVFIFFLRFFTYFP